MSDVPRSSRAARPFGSLLPVWQRGADGRFVRAFAIAVVIHAAAILLSVRPFGGAPAYQLPTARMLRVSPPLTILPPVVRGQPGGGSAVLTPGLAPLGAAPESAVPVPVPVSVTPPPVAPTTVGVANGVPTGTGGAGTGGGSGGGNGPGAGGGEVRQEFEPARLLSFPLPHYPEAARKQHITGGVVLSLHVTEEGLVDSVRMVRGLALPELNAEAVQAAHRVRYTPARLGERAVASWQTYTVNFDLP